MALADIEPTDVLGVISEMARVLSPKTVRTNYGVLKAVMNAAADDKYIIVSPCPRRPRNMPDFVERPKRRLSPAEVHRLAEKVVPDYQLMIYLGAVLGLRMSEVVGLRVRDFNLLARPTTVTVSEPLPEVSGRHVVSNGKTRGSLSTVSMPPFLVELLASHLATTGHRASEDFVFEAPNGGPVHAANFRTRIWAPAVRAAGLDGLTFHALRHSAAGFMRLANAHDQTIQRRMRHTHRPTTTDIYGWVPDEADVAVVTGLDALFQSGSDTQETRQGQAG
jgi:integrase